MKILNLNERPKYIKTISEWLYKEWGHLNPGSTLESAIQRIKERSEGNNIPSIFVAEIKGEAVGTVSLVKYDMDIRTELSPWVASLFVNKKFRHRKIGRKLMSFIESFAKEISIPKIYLFSPNKQNMYRKLGWQPIEELEYRSQYVIIMAKDLTPKSRRRGAR